MSSVQRDDGTAIIGAVHEGVWLGIFAEPVGQLLLDNQRLKLLVFDRRAEVLLRWIP